MLIAAFIVTLIMVIMPYTMSNAIVAMQPGGFTLALMGAHYTNINPDSMSSQMYGEFIALLLAAFFFMYCWTMDRPRWKYYFLSLFVYDLICWGPVYFVGLTALYFVFGMGAFIFETLSVYNDQANQPYPVTPVQYTLVKKEVRTPDGRIVGKHYQTFDPPPMKKHETLEEYNERCGVPISPIGTMPGKSNYGTLPSSGYSPSRTYSEPDPVGTVMHATSNKPIRGIRWFRRYTDKQGNDHVYSMNKDSMKRGKWDDLGQLRAHEKPTPENTSGIYTFGMDALTNPVFHAYAEPGMFAAEVDVWGTVIHHGVEDVYRGENGKIHKELFTYEEWQQLKKQHRPR